MNKYMLGLLLSGASVIAGVQSASAATYSTQSAFLAAHPGASTTSFTGLTSSIQSLGSPYTYNSITFSAPSLKAVSTNFWGSVDSLLDDTFQGHLDASFASASAVGFYLAGGYTDASPVTLKFYNGASLVSTIDPLLAGGVDGTFSYFGIDGIGPITGFSIDTTAYPGGFSSLGPLSLTSLTGGVPEPATWAMMILGIGAVGFAMRRRQQPQVRFAF